MMMNATAEKFIFLFVMIAVTLFSSGFGFANEGKAPTIVTVGASASPEAPSTEPPVFVLSSPIVEPVTGTAVAGAIDAEEPAVEQEQVPQSSLAPKAAPPDVSVNTIQSGTLTSQQTVRPAVYRPVGTVTPPTALAEAALIADLKTGESYLNQKPNRRWPIASITKLMTAVLAADMLEPTSTVTLADADFPAADTSVGKRLKPGEVYSVSDLIAAMLIVSSNEAAESLARQIGRDRFIGLMNARAAAWGMHDTHFADPTGLSSANQATALDLERLALRIYEDHPGIFQTGRKHTHTITDLAARKSQKLQNINAFAGEVWFLGGKTGYTDDAGGNLLTVFSHSYRPVAVVVLGTADRFGESERLIDWFAANYKITSLQ